jgi:ribA/ribD-fused uncharacterized protein
MKTVGPHTFFYDKSCELSNWFMRDFVVKDIKFNCNEQFMMYCKAKIFKDEVKAAQILAATWPGDHKRLGREVAGYVEEVWVQRRNGIMDHGTFHKFDQNKDLRRVMFQSLDTKFVEAAANDKIWGIGLGITDSRITDPSKWNGLNLLGESLDRSKARLIEKYPEEYAEVVAEAKALAAKAAREEQPGLGF